MTFHLDIVLKKYKIDSTPPTRTSSDSLIMKQNQENKYRIK